MKVYLVILEWGKDSEHEVELDIYSTYEKSYQKFNELIAEEKKPEKSWVGDIKWNGDVPDDEHVELDYLDRRNDTDETECYWLISDNCNGAYTYISIQIREVL